MIVITVQVQAAPERLYHFQYTRFTSVTQGNSDIQFWTEIEEDVATEGRAQVAACNIIGR